MKYTSQTGLFLTITKPINKQPKHVNFNLGVDAKHAPFTTKPFTGLFNPFAKGCSILCNHPAIPQVKKMLQKAKGHNREEQSIILPDEVAAIHAELETFKLKQKQLPFNYPDSSTYFPYASDISDLVPEELFRKYTETDSRPCTPTPTLASGQTRASATRRCVTPDPIITSEIKEKTLLVLDLRRSHSQETLSCYGGSISVNDMPLIRIMNVSLTPATSRHCLLLEKRKEHSSTLQLPKVISRGLSTSRESLLEDTTRFQATTNNLKVPQRNENEVYQDPESNNKEYIKRRGKNRKKRRTLSSVSVFCVSTDPETMVGGIKSDSKGPSVRASLNEAQAEEVNKFAKKKLQSDRSFNIDSFMDYESLRQLRRELTNEIVDMEFDPKRKIALEEALKTLSNLRVNCKELKQLQATLKVPKVENSFRFSLPQQFSRGSVRFELPMDSRVLNNMTPMEYIKDHVFISSSRKLLYAFAFNLHRIKTNLEALNKNQESPKNVVLLSPSSNPKPMSRNNSETEVHVEEEITQFNENEIREILGKDIIPALGVLMNKQLSEQQSTNFLSLMGWSLEDSYSFRTFAALCAICERLLASEFYPNLPGRVEDPCEAIEEIDFESLDRKTKGKTVDSRLLKLFQLIKTS